MESWDPSSPDSGRARKAFIEGLADRIAALAEAHPVRVGGHRRTDAGGKTTLADELAGLIAGSGRKVIRASIDGFHRPRADRYRRGESPEGYYLDSFDYPVLREKLLVPLGQIGDLRFRTAVFDLRSDSRREAPWEVAAPNSILLFDGVFLLRPELNDSWDFRIFLSVDLGEILRRAEHRDGRVRFAGRRGGALPRTICPGSDLLHGRASMGSCRPCRQL
jgi:uridine kinase